MDFFKNLKVDDEVIISNSHNKKYLSKIERITKTQIICGNAKFRRSDGRQIGGGDYSFSCIEKRTPEQIAKMKENTKKFKIIKEIKEKLNSQMLKLSLEDLNNLLDTIKEIPNQTNPKIEISLEDNSFSLKR